MSYRQKEACILVLDRCLPPALAEEAKQCCDVYIRRFLQEQRKTDQVALITLKSAGVNEDLALQPAHLSMRQHILRLAPERTTNTGERLQDALSLARRRLVERTKQLKYKRTVVVFTDGSKCSDVRELQKERELLEGMYGKRGGGGGADDDDDEEEASSPTGVKWEIFLLTGSGGGQQEEEQEGGERSLVEVFGERAVTRLPRGAQDMFKLEKRQVGQVKKWQGELEVGPLCKLHCIMVARIAEDKLKSLVKRSKLAMPDDGSTSLEDFLDGEEGKVKMDRQYLSSAVSSSTAEEEEEPREVTPEERSRAFRYGKDLLPMMPADEEAMRLEDTTKPELKVIGVIPRHELKREYMISAVNCIVADPNAPHSQEGLSALVQALKELNQVLLCRFVAKAGKAPKLVGLLPGQTTAQDIDCLWHVQLPTMEDVRDYQFEPSAAAGAQMSKVEEDVTERYVTAMTFTSPLDAPETKQFSPEFTYNPYVARYWEVVHFKAVNPELPVPPASQLVSAMISVDGNMQRRSARAARQFKKVFGLSRIVHKKPLLEALPEMMEVVGTASTSTAVKEEEDGDESELWFADETKSLVEFVGTITPVEDFWAIMARVGGGDVVAASNCILELQQVVTEMVGPVSGDSLYHDKALACLKALREACRQRHLEQRFNSYMGDLKQGLLLASAESEFWRRMVEEKIELLELENEAASVSSQDFYSSSLLLPASSSQMSSASGGSQSKIFSEDLFDDME